LKQSDHRPVVSVIDIEAFAVNESKRDRIFHEVIKQLGPADATVILDADDPGVFDYEDSDQIILNELAGCGDVVLVRHIGSEMWITFRDGVSALAACQLQCIQVRSLVLGVSVEIFCVPLTMNAYCFNCQIGDYVLKIRLKTEDWDNHLEKEMSLCINNCVALVPGQNNNTLKGVSSCSNLIAAPGKCFSK